MREWAHGSFGPVRAAGSPAHSVPFSFTYGGTPSSELLPTWSFHEEVEPLDPPRVRRTQTYSDPDTGLVVRSVIVEYHDYPVVEWTVYLRNNGTADTPILEDIQALDVHFGRGETGGFLLHHSVGSPCQPNDYQPLVTALGPGAPVRIGAAGGRPTNSDLSYFNLEMGTEPFSGDAQSPVADLNNENGSVPISRLK